MTLVTLSPPAEGFSRLLKLARAKTESPFTLDVNRQDWGGESWRFSFTSVEMSMLGEGREFGGTLEGLSASGETFLLRDPTAAQPRFSGQVVTLSEASAAGSTVLNLAGMSPQKVRVGDFLSLPRGGGLWDFHHVVRVLSDPGGGLMQVSVRPALRRGFTSGTAVELEDPLVTVEMESDNGGDPHNFSYPFQVSYVFSASEVS